MSGASAYMNKSLLLWNGAPLQTCHCAALKFAFPVRLNVFLVKYLVLLEVKAILTHNCIIKSFLERMIVGNHKSIDFGVPLDFMMSLNVMCHLVTPSLILAQLGNVTSISVQYLDVWKLCCKRFLRSSIKQATNRHNGLCSSQNICNMTLWYLRLIKLTLMNE